MTESVRCERCAYLVFSLESGSSDHVDVGGLKVERPRSRKALEELAAVRRLTMIFS